MINLTFSVDSIDQLKSEVAEAVAALFPEAVPAKKAPQPADPVAAQPAPIVQLQQTAAPAPTAAPVAQAPVAVKPCVKLADLQQAVGIFCETGQAARQSILSTLQAYGVQALTQLTPEQLEDFANRVRAMGAKI